MSSIQYYPFSNEDLRWLHGLLRDMADDPHCGIADVGQLRDGIVLELYFLARGATEYIIDERACLALAELVKERTGVSSPIVYNLSRPHPAAQTAIATAPGRREYNALPDWLR